MMALQWVLFGIVSACLVGMGYIIKTSKVNDLDDFYIISDAGDEVEHIYNKKK